jgi:hypothetical protein
VEASHDHGTETTTVVREERAAEPIVHDSGMAHAGESEVTTTGAAPWDFARGWVRFLQSIIGFGLLLVETLLTFRLVFALTGANPANGFVDFIYGITGPLVAPFENIANERVIDGQSVFEPETVIAMLVWGVAALLLLALLNVLLSAPAPHQSVTSRERSSHYDRTM